MSFSRFEGLLVHAPAGVYAPRSDTALLASQMGPVEGATVLELCAGSGAVALSAARRGAARVVAVDRSRRAVLAMRANARLNRLPLEARRGDLYGALAQDERFDVILANPPYLPAVGAARRRDHRWDAGPDGRAVLDRILAGACRHLRGGGRLVLAQSMLANLEVTRVRLQSSGLELVGRAEQRGPFGPIVSARREALVQCGALAREDRLETLVVLTAAGPGGDRTVAGAGPAP